MKFTEVNSFNFSFDLIQKGGHIRWQILEIHNTKSDGESKSVFFYYKLPSDHSLCDHILGWAVVQCIYSHPAFLPSFTLITCPSIFYLWIDFLFLRTLSFKGILHQKFFYRLYLIFWIVMGCGIARFGWRGLKTTETWKFWSQNLSPGVLRLSLEVKW